MNQAAVAPAIYAAYIAAGVAFFAALLSFIASWVSNRTAKDRLERQLNHDTDQRNRERAMTLRREVYIPAMEAVTRLSSLLTKAHSSTDSLPELAAQISANIATLSKVDVVASETTVKALIRFTSELNPALAELTMSRLGIAAIDGAIQIEKSRQDIANSEVQRL